MASTLDTLRIRYGIWHVKNIMVMVMMILFCFVRSSPRTSLVILTLVSLTLEQALRSMTTS